MWWCCFIIWMISLSCSIMWMIYKLYSISSSQILDSNLSWWRSLVTFLSFSPRPTLNTKERLWASDGLSVWARVWLSLTPEAVAQEAPVPMGVSRQGYWSGLPCPSPGYLPNPGIKPLHCRSILYSLSHQGAQENWSGQPIPSPVDLFNPGIELGSPALQVYSLPAELPGKFIL